MAELGATMIQDPMLRELFRAESAEHLQRLDEVLLQLEQTPAEQALLEEAFREAHSMKGAARMLGLSSIQVLAHKLEDGLNLARHGVSALNREAVSVMLRQIAEIGDLVKLAVQEGATAPAAAGVPLAQPRVAQAVAVAPAVAVPSAVFEAAPEPSLALVPLQIESVRVDTRRLDELMTHSGELVVTRTRVLRRLSDIDDLLDEVARAAQAPHADLPASLGLIEDSLRRVRRAHAEDGARLEALSGALDSAVRQIRLLPLSNLLKLYARMVRELAQEQDKEVELLIEGEETQADKRILEEMKDPLMHLLRNAIDHGIEPPAERLACGKPARGRISIKASQKADSVVIEVSDDGRGLDAQAIRNAAAKRALLSQEALAAMSTEQLQALILLPGLSTKAFVTDVSGRGVGMDVVHANVERLKGSLSIASTAGQGSAFVIRLPVTLATLRVLLVEVNGLCYGLPADAVIVSRSIAPSGVFALEGRNAVLHRGTPLAVAPLADLLELSSAGPHEAVAEPATDGLRPCVFMQAGGESFGVFIDALLDEQEVVLKPQCPLLHGLRNVLGATLLSSGDICMVLKPHDLLASLARAGAPPVAPRRAGTSAQRKKLILLAEDSITTRAQEIRILEGAGYEVVAAIDGQDAYAKLAARQFDALVSDINMPRMDGLELAKRVRAISQYAHLPIILVTSLATDEDKRRGLEIGANAYITKPEFDQSILLDCLERLVG